tara:strand:+ start:131 stop:715 length:585 start_codon:yes stop_codon:yes gene_type:complete
MKFDLKYIVIIILVAIIILMRSCEATIIPKEPIVITKYDTIWKKTHDTIIKKVNVDRVKYVPFEKIIFANVEACMKEYNRQTTYKDTITLDSIGTITVIDTVFQNELKERIIIKDYKIPLVTKTITIIKQPDPKRQLYIGGNLFGDERTLQIITPGILYKDRKDRIFQANVGVDFDGKLTFGVGTYWKINLNKK